MTIRPFRKPFTIAGAALGAIVLSLYLTTAPGVTTAHAKTLEDYAEGTGGEFQCYPPPDTTPCGESFSNPRLELMKREIIAKCSSHFKDDNELQKFYLAVPGLAIPGLRWVFLTYLLSEFAEDATKCVLKGFLSYGGHPEWESSVDDAFAVGDAVFLAHGLQNANLGDKINQVRAEMALSGKDRFKDLSDKVERSGTYEDIKTFEDLYASWLGGRFGGQQVTLNAAKRMTDSCLFEEADKEIQKAGNYLRESCRKAGNQHRFLEKNIRCLEEFQARFKAALKKHAEAERRKDPLWQFERRPGKTQKELLIELEKSLDEPSIAADQRKLLLKWQTELLQDLEFLAAIKEANKYINTRKTAFDAWEQKYKAIAEFALERLQDNDQENACTMVRDLREMEKVLQGWTPECRDRICMPFGGRLAGDKYEEILTKINARINEDIVANLAEVQTALERPCNLESARTLLKTIETDADKIWEYKRGQCVPGAGDFGKDLTAIRATLKEREAADEQVKALLEKARKLAKSECTFDQALTEAIEEEILKNMEKGCAAGEDVSRQIAEIRRLAGQFAMNADAQEQGIAGLINDIMVSLDPAVPNCRLDEARKTLNEASKQFGSHLACEAADPAPSQAVRDRAARVRALLGEAEQFIEKRTAEVKQAELKYQEALGKILAGTDDACNYKAALSDENVNALSKFAKESCQTEKMSNDLGTVREAISKWDQRIAADLAKMERATMEIRNEPDCAAAEAMLRKIKGDTEYLAECEEYKAAVAAALDAMTEAIREKKENAERAVNQAVAEAEGKYEQCRDLEQAAVDVLAVKDKVPQSCISAEALVRLDAISGKLKKLAEDMKSRATRILELCQNAEREIRRCEWSAADEKIAEAQRMFPGEPCYSAQLVFKDLSRRVQSVESNEKTQKHAMDQRRDGIFYKIKNAWAHIAKSRKPEENPQGQLEAYKTNVGPVEDEKKEIEGSQELMACLGDLMAKIDAVLAEAAKPAPASPGTGGGFSSAGGGQTQQGDPAAPDKQTDGGFSAAGPGVTKKNDPGNPADGFFAAGVPGITTPLASPDSGGFSSAGSGATSHSDPTAGNEGTSGNRDARPPAASVGTPPSGSTPIIVRPQPFRGDGQPAAVHIFAATSRMGWAGGLAQYSVGPSDQSIVEHLMTAGEHVMWANKMSFPPTPAWPGWSEKRSWLQSQANELARNRTNDYRRQIAGSMSGNYGSMCSELSVQTFGTTQKAANCDAYYCRLGFLMARGQQALLIADEANNNRDKQTTDKARADGLSHLSQAVQVLSDYERVLAVSGRCADLRDVKQMLMNIIRGGNIPDQARAATAAWQTALERIAALGQGGAPQPGKYEECLRKYCPECLQTIDLLGVAKDQKCNDCKRKNGKLINECVAGTPSPVGRPVPPQPADPRAVRDPRPNDSTELEGVWTEWLRLGIGGGGYQIKGENSAFVSERNKFIFKIKNYEDHRNLLRQIAAAAKDMTHIKPYGNRGIAVEFRKSGGRYSGRMTQGTISIADPFFGHHVLGTGRLSPGTELFKLDKVGEDEYQGDYLSRASGDMWFGGRRVVVLGDYAAEFGNSPTERIIWKRVR